MTANAKRINSKGKVIFHNLCSNFKMNSTYIFPMFYLPKRCTLQSSDLSGNLNLSLLKNFPCNRIVLLSSLIVLVHHTDGQKINSRLHFHATVLSENCFKKLRSSNRNTYSDSIQNCKNLRDQKCIQIKQLNKVTGIYFQNTNLTAIFKLANTQFTPC